MVFVYKSEPMRGEVWARRFAEELPEIRFRSWPDIGTPGEVRFMAAWEPPQVLSIFPNLEILFSVGAGIDQFDLRGLPPQMKLVRMIEPGLIAGMVEYVIFAILALHRDLPIYLARQRTKEWKADRVRPAGTSRVGVMGAGVLGWAVLEALAPFGFLRQAWMRSRRNIPGVTCFAGREELNAFLAETDILVCLLPLTAETKGILDVTAFSVMPKGASLVNAGRGGHLIEQDLLNALDTGQIGSAILDVASSEPPALNHPFWTHPHVWLTPHIASSTQAESGADAIIANLRRHLAGKALHGQVDIRRGY